MAENMKREDFERLGWRRESYSIGWGLESRRVRGYVKGPWGIRRADKIDREASTSGWFLTHISIGYAAIQECRSPQAVIGFAAFLNRLGIDWQVFISFTDLSPQTLKVILDERQHLLKEPSHG